MAYVFNLRFKGLFAMITDDTSLNHLKLIALTGPYTAPLFSGAGGFMNGPASACVWLVPPVTAQANQSKSTIIESQTKSVPASIIYVDKLFIILINLVLKSLLVFYLHPF